MSRTNEERENIAHRIYSAIPDVFGLDFLHSTEVTEFHSDGCVVQFGWERYEAKLSSIQFIDPSASDTTEGMAFWVLQHILGFRVAVRDGADPYCELGMAIVNHCEPLLRGDFEIRCKYDSLEKRILDRAFGVGGLPEDNQDRLPDDSRVIR